MTPDTITTGDNLAVQIRVGDCRDLLAAMPAESVQCCVTSPPYWGLRDYGHGDQIGQEATPELFVEAMVGVFREVRRILKDDGVLFLNLGDSYGDGKQLQGIPWRVALALQADGWILRQDIIWAKPNPMPESVTDRCTKAHEYIFLLSKSAKYFYDAEAIAEPVSETAGAQAWRRIFDPAKQAKESVMKGQGVKGGNDGQRNPDATTRNKRSVWTVSTAPYAGAHFATFPPDLIKPCIMAGTATGDTVIDPFGGSGTTGMVATELARKAILCELNPEYAALADRRTDVTPGLPL